jgi:hypothetical protein
MTMRRSTRSIAVGRRGTRVRSRCKQRWLRVPATTDNRLPGRSPAPGSFCLSDASPHAARIAARRLSICWRVLVRAVAAGALLPPCGAAIAILADDRGAPGAAAAAHQAGQQEAVAVRLVERRAGGGAALAVPMLRSHLRLARLLLRPEFVVDDKQLRHRPEPDPPHDGGLVRFGRPRPAAPSPSQAHAVEGQPVLQVGRVGKPPAQAVHRLADHDVEQLEAASPSSLRKPGRNRLAPLTAASV